MSRWHDKADAFVHAWRMNYGDDPSLQAVVLGLSVAQHETRAGDAWPGADGVVGTADDENNWGATTLRALNAEERAVLKAAGITPTVGAGHEARAKAAQAAIQAAGLPMPQANIHCDSAPSLGPYFVWFAAFSNPIDGAAYFLKLLCGLKTRKMAYSVLTQGGNEVQLATAMYLAGYYTGFYKKASEYVRTGNGWREMKPGETLPTGAVTKKGSDLNIAAYAGALQNITPSIRLALKDWHPPSGEPTEDPAPETEPPLADTDPAPPLLPLEVDWDELRRARDALIKEEWES